MEKYGNYAWRVRYSSMQLHLWHVQLPEEKHEIFKWKIIDTEKIIKLLPAADQVKTGIFQYKFLNLSK